MEYFKRVWCLNRTSYSGDYKVPILEKKKEIIFDGLTGPATKMAIPQHDPRDKLTKVLNYGHIIPWQFTQGDKSNNKALILMIELASVSWLENDRVISSPVLTLILLVLLC